MDNLKLIAPAMMIGGVITAVLGEYMLGDVFRELGLYCALFGGIGTVIGGVPK